MTSGVPVQVRSYFCCWDIASHDSLVKYTLTTEKITNPLCLPKLSYSHLQAYYDLFVTNNNVISL